MWRHLARGATNVLLAAASRLIPRTDAIWVVGGSKGVKYGDNAMYFFKYCARHLDKRVVWLARAPKVVREVRDDGHEAHRITSLMGIWLGLRAKWHAYDVKPSDTGPTNRGAYLLNLWHGVPLKDIRFLKPQRKPAARTPRTGKRMLGDKDRLEKSFFVHPDRVHISHILDSFELLPQNIIYANLPRNIVFKSGESTENWCKARDLPLICRLQKLAKEGGHIIGYFPTWRGGTGDLFMGTLELPEIERINDFLKTNNCYLLTKWHDCVYSTYNHPGANASAEALIAHLRRQSNFVVLDFDADLNSHLPLCELMVTDYSSVLFDYLLIDRPIVFLAYDIDGYRDRWGFLFDYETFIPGPITKNIDELIAVLAQWRSGIALGYGERRAEYRSTFFEHDGGTDVIVKRMQEVAN